MNPTTNPPTSKAIRLAAPLLCLLAVLAAYSNSTPNAFTLDDWHTIQDNPAIRSFDAPHLKRFFTDVNAFSVLPRNIDYRPALLVTYAANYALSSALHGDGYDTRSWHWLNIALHLSSVIGLFFTARALIGPRGLSPIPSIPTNPGGPADLLCLAAALLFAIHPMNSGAINYISARSSVMVAALLLPALAIYLNVLARTISPRWLLCTGLLYLIALLTKIEAVAFIAVLGLAECLFFQSAPALLASSPAASLAPSPAPGGGGGRSFVRPEGASRIPRLLSASLRLAPFALLSLSYLYLWKRMSTLAENPGKASADMTAPVYLLTQVRAWWYYIGEGLAPVRLVFDEAAYPISGAALAAEQPKGGLSPLTCALLDTRVWLAISAWILTAAACLRLLRRAPLVPFLVGSYLILISPSSSIVPLAEMVNDHRPYLPIAGLFLLAIIGLWLLLRAMTTRPHLAFALVAALLAIPLLAMTRDRNLIFRSDLTLYADTAAKSPESARAQMNYGLALMRLGKNAEAEARFRRSLATWPNWHYTHSNLAIVLAIQGNYAAASAEHDLAVNCGGGEPGPYYWRGRFRASQGDTPGAIADFQSAVNLNPSAFKEAAALAAALAHAGKTTEAEAVTAKHGAVNPSGFAAERTSAATLFIPPESSMSLNDRAVKLMAAARYTEAENLLRESLRRDPRNHLAHSNLGVIRMALGDQSGALAAHDEAVRTAPDDPSPYYWRSRYYIKQSDYDRAITDLTTAADRSHHDIHETAGLVECLLRAGKSAQAQAVISAAVQAGKSESLDKERAAFRAAVFGER